MPLKEVGLGAFLGCGGDDIGWRFVLGGMWELMMRRLLKRSS